MIKNKRNSYHIKKKRTVKTKDEKKREENEV